MYSSQNELYLIICWILLEEQVADITLHWLSCTCRNTKWIVQSKKYKPPCKLTFRQEQNYKHVAAVTYNI